MRRIALYYFHDAHGVVDQYVPHFLRKLRDFADDIVFASNGPLSTPSQILIRNITSQLLIRSNEGFQAWAHKQALEMVGTDKLAGYDEVLLLNDSFFGPIFPLSELFSEMEKRVCDFWGVTARAAAPPPFTRKGNLPAYIDPSFIAVRKTLAQSEHFRAYWNNLPAICNPEAQILLHDSVFTQHFVRLGYKATTYLDPQRYGTHDPAKFDIDQTIVDRNPLLTRRLFIDDPTDLERHATDLPRALRLIKQSSDYNLELIWRSVIRSAQLRHLNTNAALTTVFPDIRLKQGAPINNLKIAICAHIYYTEMMAEILTLTNNIPMKYDFIATTDSLEKKKEIEQALATHRGIGKSIVRIVEQNRGRDMSSLFITCRDLFLGDTYDLVCRLHTKKSPQVAAGRGQSFKRHMFENLLNSAGYVSNVLDMFEDCPWIGVAVPPLVHISYTTFGRAWYSNRLKASKTARLLGLNITLDQHTPIAAYGTMFWFRPQALRLLFEHKWDWKDFNAEPHHIDASLAHVLERLIAYVAQDAGYTTQQILCTRSAEWNYVMMEYKLQTLQSYLPPAASFDSCINILTKWKRAGYPTVNFPFLATLKKLELAVKASLAAKMPILATRIRRLRRHLACHERISHDA